MSAYRQILVAVDGSDAAGRGMDEAIRLAKAEGAALCVVHVVSPAIAFAPLTGAAPADLTPALREAGRRLLERARLQARRRGVRATSVLHEGADRGVAAEIVSLARRRRADLIVLGTHGRRGLRRMVLGSDAEQVVRASRVPVLLVRA